MNISTVYKFQKGDKIGDFTVIAPVGSGSYGEVYYVRDMLDKKFALKVIRGELTSKSEREIEGITALRQKIRSDEFLPTIYFVGKYEGMLYYTMDPADNCSTVEGEYLPDTLHERLSRKQHFSAEQILDIAETLLKSLSLLHANDLVHRDIKPSNIIFLNGKCMLTDFGLITADPQTYLGSPGFLAPFPENGITLQSEKEADLYAVGKVIYCIFSGNSADRYPMLPDDYNVSELARIRPLYIKACTAVSSKRFSSCADFLVAVKEARSGKSNKHRMIFFIAAAAALLIAAATFALLYNTKTPKEASTQKTPPQSIAANDSGAILKIEEDDDGYNILCCYSNRSQAEDGHPHFRANQFKAMHLVKCGLDRHLAKNNLKLQKIKHIRYLKQPFREGSFLVYIYQIKKNDCNVTELE